MTNKFVYISNIFIDYDRKEEQRIIISQLESRIKEIKPDLIIIGGNVIKNKESRKDYKYLQKYLKFLKNYTVLHYMTYEHDVDMDLGATQIILGDLVINDITYNLFRDDNKKLAIKTPTLTITFPPLIQQNINDDGPFGFKINDLFEEIYNESGFFRLTIKNNIILNNRFMATPQKWLVEYIDTNSDFDISLFVKKWGPPINRLYSVDPVLHKYEDFISNLSLHNCFQRPEKKEIIDLKHIYCEDILCFCRIDVDFVPMYNKISGIVASNEMGKSSFIKIIVAAVTNTVDTTFIRAGKHFGKIVLTTSKGEICYSITSHTVAKTYNLNLVSYESLANTSLILPDSNDIEFDDKFIKKSLNLIPDVDLFNDIKSTTKELSLYKIGNVKLLENKISTCKNQITILEKEIQAYDKSAKKHENLEEKIAKIEKCLFAIDGTVASRLTVHDISSTEDRPTIHLDELLEHRNFLKTIDKHEIIAKISVLEEEIARKNKYLALFTKEPSDAKIAENRRIIKEHTNTGNLERDTAFLIVSKCTNIYTLLEQDVKNDETELKRLKNDLNRAEKIKNFAAELEKHKAVLVKRYFELSQDYNNFTFLSKLEQQLSENKTLINKYQNEIEEAKKYEIVSRKLDVLNSYRFELYKANKSILDIQSEKIVNNVNEIIGGNITYDKKNMYYKGVLVKNNSTYRRFSINLAIKLSLWQLTQKSVLNALIIDENFGACDSDHIKIIMQILDNISCNMYMPKLIFVISHLDYVKSRIEYKLNIKKTDDGIILKNDV